jgi:hypothetical protein
MSSLVKETPHASRHGTERIRFPVRAFHFRGVPRSTLDSEIARSQGFLRLWVLIPALWLELQPRQLFPYPGTQSPQQYLLHSYVYCTASATKSQRSSMDSPAASPDGQGSFGKACRSESSELESQPPNLASPCSPSNSPHDLVSLGLGLLKISSCMQFLNQPTSQTVRKGERRAHRLLQ